MFEGTVWDTSAILSDTSLLGRVLHTLVGYTDQPSGMQLLVYTLTLFMIFGLTKAFKSPLPKKRPRPPSMKSLSALAFVAALAPELASGQTVQDFIIDPSPPFAPLEKTVDYFTSHTTPSIVLGSSSSVRCTRKSNFESVDMGRVETQFRKSTIHITEIDKLTSLLKLRLPLSKDFGNAKP